MGTDFLSALELDSSRLDRFLLASVTQKRELPDYVTYLKNSPSCFTLRKPKPDKAHVATDAPLIFNTEFGFNLCQRPYLQNFTIWHT